MDMQLSDAPGQPLVVALAGRLDTLGVDSIETRFNAGVTATGRPALLDLAQVDFVSSMGIRLLISAAKTMRARQQRLAMVVPAGPVREMLEVAAIDTLIPMFERRDEALAALGC